MNIEKTRIKRFIIILLMFIVLVLLPTFISSLGSYAYNYKTITSSKSSDETYAHLLNALDNRANSYSNFPSIENNNLSGLDGFNLHSQADSSDSESNSCHVWNRAVGYGTGKSYRTTAFCYHADVSSPANGVLRKIRGIFIIDDGKMDYIWTNKLSNANDKNSAHKDNISYNNNIYFQKMLANLYVSQNNYDVAWDCANYYMYSGARNTWVKKAATELWGNENNVERIANFTVPKSYGGFRPIINGFNNDYAWNQSDNKEYRYKAIFIFSDTAGGQGTFYYRVVREKKTPTVTVNLSKTDTLNNRVNGAEVKITGVENVSKINSGNSASLTIGSGSVKIIPVNNTGSFKLIVTETAPNGYKGIGTVELTVKYNTSTGAVTSITSNNTTYVPNSSNSSVTIKNTPHIETLKLLKTDSLKGDKLPKATFSIELSNVTSLKGHSTVSEDGKIIISKTTNTNGELILEDIVIKDVTKPVIVKIKETTVPTGNGYYYKPIEMEFTIKYSKQGEKYTVQNVNTSSSIGTISSDTNSNITIAAKNQPYIKLDGAVWLDGQSGIKNIEGPNGKKATAEEGIDGVLVQLYDIKNKKVKAETTTANGGKYSFSDVEMTNEGYSIIFNYDGINYIETKAYGKDIQNYGTDSKATEQNRKTFNERFKTISGGKSNDGTPLSYEYKDKVSTLKVGMNGTNPESKDTNKQFRMSAKTGVYKTTSEGINCGLVKKEFDLALGTDVKNARLELNGKSIEYTYAQVMDGEMEDLKLDEILQGKSSDKTKQDADEKIIYNLYLYVSDYNYRIADYKTDAKIQNQVNPTDNENKDYENLKELQAYVTYNVILKGQTTQTAKVNKFEYYYDSVYTPYKIDGQKIVEGKTTYTGDKYNFEIDSNNRKITFTSRDNTPNIEGPNYRVVVDLEFKVISDDKGPVTLKNNVKNIAEIMEYSTVEGGLIDKDSAPANGITQGAITQYEDDTDEAAGINISLKENATRTIKGTVFEDINKDGTNNDNTPVNDVIVQLIEIKQIKGNNYEYIWQETRSGSNTVKTTGRNGYQGQQYKNSVTAGSGQYEFKDFIPGDYIIRYIYGDGRTYDVTDNVKKYNGQDYKSTIDEHYREEWYNVANYTENESVARDNEARRLEVMSYSSTINKEIGEALENKSTLDKTWMAAETSKLNVQIDTETNPNKDATVKLEGVNFGLAKRPETRLVLEKHITGLKITPNGTGVQPIVDAKADISKIVNDNSVNPTGVKGVTDGLSIIKSTRENRGFWQVATDIEELAQGAELEVEYTYSIRNDGDNDYLSDGLVDSYIQNPDSYSETLKKAAESKKISTKGNTQSYGEYLGEYYYLGKTGNKDKLVPSRVETLEEALNNDLTFTSGEDFKKINEVAVKKMTIDKDGNERKDGQNNPTTEITTVVQNTSASSFLTPKAGNKYESGKDIDYSKTITLRTLLSSSNGGEIGTNLPSYIAEVVTYSNAAGRRNSDAVPGNLSYVHSEDTNKTMASDNEPDEFWGETIIVTKPTGEDKLTPIQIAIITITATAVVGVGIILIKKFVLKK